MKKELEARNENTSISTDVRPSFAGQGRGNENVHTEDLVIPRIGIIQALSPERKKNDAQYIEGAEEGMMFNSVTRKLYRGNLLVIPVFYRKEFFLWKLRKEGGGFRGVFPTHEDAANAQIELTERTEIMDTGQQFCLVSDNDGQDWTEAVISMSSSNAGVSKKWNSDIKLKEADRFANVYTISVVEKSNEKGEFFIFKVEWKRWATQEQYNMGEQSYLAIKKGVRDVSRDYSDPDSAPASSNNLDDEAAF